MNGYKVVESFTDHRTAFVSFLCCTAQGRGDAVTDLSLLDLFRFIRNTNDGEEPLRVEEERHFWDPVMNKGSGAEDRSLRQSGIVGYFLTSQLLMHQLVNDAGQLM